MVNSDGTPMKKWVAKPINEKLLKHLCNISNLENLLKNDKAFRKEQKITELDEDRYYEEFEPFLEFRKQKDAYVAYNN